MTRKTVGLGVSLLVGALWPMTSSAAPAGAAADSTTVQPTSAEAPATSAPATNASVDASAGVGVDAGAVDGSVAAEGPAPADSGLSDEDIAAAEAADASSTETASSSNSGGEPWIRRYRPRRNSFEFGIYGGIFLNSREHELFDPVMEQAGRPDYWKPYRRVAPSFGLRFAYYPLSFLGGELEGGAMPTWSQDIDTGENLARATHYSFHGSVIGQLPFWSIAPFVLVGGGLLGTSGALGSDVDPSIHFGGGVKFFLNDWVLLRLDIRDHMAAKRNIDDGATHYPEFLIGLSLRFGGKPSESVDSDGDGYIDEEDACPYDPENYNGYEDEDGCPEYDRDGDGFFDNQDACPDVPGVAPDGCPPKDSDGDGFLDSQDACPNEPGVPPDGCPIRDSDKDGILDPDDQCVYEPENYNGFEDEDGCPDEMPETALEFNGVIQGIFFDFNKATIKAKSMPVLDRAVSVLSEFPSLRVEISGHTDNKGSAEYNQKLSQERAESVKTYLVSKGVPDDRVITRGAGEDEPIDTNKTARGRAKNRRIEFKILVAKPAGVE
ncbi:MAG: OmpA family protein [Myxococcales bacterium]|nr:OmpA family protein [Myxococcales bacterium]